ncbi:MAG: amidohydrolase family protein [Ruminococcaceae bacterium]|nr:amidohydrolase family protein [Oscillospiraceae bacterium]
MYNREFNNKSNPLEFEYPSEKGRLILKGGRVVDPKNKVDGIFDVEVVGDRVVGLGAEIVPASADRTVDCTGLVVMPGIIDIHLHIGDLFDISNNPLMKAAKEGVTTALSPGAGNTFMSPSLLGAESDRGLPINTGVYIGAAAALATRLTNDELVALIEGGLDSETASLKLSGNTITNSTAGNMIGIKEHKGHFILPDEAIERLFDITSRGKTIFMTHTQQAEHAEHLARLSKGRPFHLGHATAAGCGSFGDAVSEFERVLSLVDSNITAEFVSSMLLENYGRHDGLKINPRVQESAFKALSDKKVKLLVSDGQSAAVMKGFGNSADNIPAIFRLSSLGVLSLTDAVATMTSEAAGFLSLRTGNEIFSEKFGHLGKGAYANITVADPNVKRCVYTVVNGKIVSFDENVIHSGFSAGRFICKYGALKKTGAGDINLYGKHSEI